LRVWPASEIFFGRQDCGQHGVDDQPDDHADSDAFPDNGGGEYVDGDDYVQRWRLGDLQWRVVQLDDRRGDLHDAGSAVGSHTFTAVYAGDANFQGSTSNPQTVSVSVPLVTLSVGGFPTADHIGAAHTVTVTAEDGSGTAIDGYTGTSGAVSGMETGTVVDDFVWVLNSSGTLSKIDTLADILAACINSHGTDAGGNVWVTDSSANTLTELGHSGAALSYNFCGALWSRQASLREIFASSKRSEEITAGFTRSGEQ